MGYFGSSAFAGIKAGSSDVTKIYVGSILAWSAAPAATDPNFSSVQLLLHGEGVDTGTTIVDNSNNAFSPSALTNVTTSTTQFKYGSASLRFNAGVAEYANNAAFYPAGDDFTWEAFVRFDTKTFNGLFVLGDSVAAGFGVNFTYELYFHNTSNTLRFVYSTDGTNITTLSYAFTPTANTWYHIAVVRSGTGLSIFVDGTLLSTETISGTFFNNTTAPYRLGCIRGDGVDVYQLTGYMDEVRFTNGVARYTGNFTPPTAAFPDSAPAPVFTGFQTGFEVGDTQFTVQNNGAVSTSLFYSGAQGYVQSNATSVAAEAELLNTGLATNKRYEGFSMWNYPSGGGLIDGTGDYRMALMGTCTDFYQGGWGLYTRVNGFAVCSSAFFEEFTSAVTNISPATWWHCYVQLDWGAPAANRDTVMPSFSIWVNGTLAVNAQTPTGLPAFGTPTNGLDCWALTGSLSSTQTGVDRGYDQFIANTSDSLIIDPGAGNTTPAAIEAALLAF